MKFNERKVDSIIRVVFILAIIIIIVFVMKSWWGLIGILPIATGLAV